jgi:hypothetical protein
VFGQIRSVYTILDQRHCRSLPIDPKESEVTYKGVCTGVGGYKLKVANFDLHHLLDLVTPGGKEFNVGIDSVSYNFLGTRAEWRVRRGKPFALIVRYNLVGPMSDKVSGSILVVSKISNSKACVVGRIEGSRTQNIQARQLADSAASKPCKSDD